jgi:hypothetical protein
MRHWKIPLPAAPAAAGTKKLGPVLGNWLLAFGWGSVLIFGVYQLTKETL